jgi:predicted transposase YbfD/YdcC
MFAGRYSYQGGRSGSDVLRQRQLSLALHPLGELAEVARSAGWKGMNMIGMLESERAIAGEISRETRFYVASTGTNVEPFAGAVRAHWGVENPLHWSLDVAFREDESRVCDPQARENLALMRCIALIRLTHDDTNSGLHGKRLKAGWDERYLTKLIFEAPKTPATASASKGSNIRKT